jgi:hypothetical protein
MRRRPKLRRAVLGAGVETDDDQAAAESGGLEQPLRLGPGVAFDV